MSETNRKANLKIRIFGTFSVTGPDGADLTPSSMKSHGLLALLVTSRNHKKRTRPWMQDKLWSRSSAQNGSTSLRQELRTIRKKLGVRAHLLLSDRHVVWLESDLFQSDLDDLQDPDWETFLEGIDIDDPEFNTWLMKMRNQGRGLANPGQRHMREARQHNRCRVVMVQSGTTSILAQFLEAEFVNLLSRSLMEFGIADVSERQSDKADPFAFEVSVVASPLDDCQCGFRASVLHSRSNRILWSDTKVVPASAGQIEGNLPLITLTHMIQSAIVREISFATEETQGIDQRALVLGKSTPRIFSFDAEQLEIVDRKLQQITDGPEHAIALAWRTQVSVIQDIEQLTTSPEEVVERGLYLAAKALEANSMNSLVLSSTANAHIFLDWDIPKGAELARLAIRVNPSNPLAWWSYANVALYSHETEKALKSAKIASQLAENSPLRFWCKFQLGLAALQFGDLELAKRSLEASAAVAPNFRPPRRYLLAIYAHLGQLERAIKMVGNLKNLEKDFTLDRFVRDDGYPISLARRMKLIDPNVFVDLG